MYWILKHINKWQFIVALLSDNISLIKKKNVLLLITICVWAGATAITRSFIISSILLIIIWLFNGIVAQKSCGSLLFYWIMVCLAATSYTLVILQISFETEEGLKFVRPFMLEIIISIIIAFIWIISALLAEDEAARMALIVTNSTTTIATVILQMLVLHFTRSVTNAFFWETLQYVIYYILLPFILAGYFSYAFKELQIYAKKKHPEKVVLNSIEYLVIQKRVEAFTGKIEEIFRKQ